MYPSGSVPAYIYGTSKMHKFSSSDSFPKLRPIVSSIGTFNYNLVHFLSNLLPPLVANDYLCNNSFSFVSQIKNVNLSRKFLVSYDVTNPFTNISSGRNKVFLIDWLFKWTLSRSSNVFVYSWASRMHCKPTSGSSAKP